MRFPAEVQFRRDFFARKQLFGREEGKKFLQFGMFLSIIN